MYIINDICYAGEMQDGIEITAAKPLEGRMMLVTFSTGEKRLWDTTTLQGPAFAPLKDAAAWKNPVIQYGTITWMDGGIDIAPETVYQESYAYDSEEAA